MKNIKKPSFIFGLGSHIVFVIALFLMANDYPYATWVMYGGLAMGAIYWILTIIEVANAGPEELKKISKIILVDTGGRNSDVWCFTISHHASTKKEDRRLITFKPQFL